MKKYLIFALLFMLSGLLASLTSYNSYAIEPGAGVVYAYAGSGGVYTSCNFTVTTSMCSPTNPSITGFSFYPTSPINLTVGSYWLEAFITFSSNGTADAPLIVGVPTYSPDGTIISFESVSSTTRGSTTVRIYRLIMKWSGGTVINSSNAINISNSSPWVNSAGYMVNSFTFYRVTDADATNQQIINSINSQSSTLNSINSGIQSLNNTMDSLNDNEGRVADVAEDEYNQTQEDRQNASSDANGFSFNFSLPNPFNLFQVNDGCVDTPTIDSWLHLEGDWQSPHCPVFPTNVRSALTPILSLLISLACLMVVIRWVSNSSSDVANGINTVVKSEKGGKS